jgi:hypothetical protein
VILPPADCGKQQQAMEGAAQLSGKYRWSRHRPRRRPAWRWLATER